MPYKKPNCKVCDSPMQKKIEKEILKGATYVSIQKKFDVSRNTVKKHKMEHMSIEVARSMMSRIPSLQVPKMDVIKGLSIIKNTDACIEFVHQELIKMYIEACEEENKLLKLAILKQIPDNIALVVRSSEVFRDLTLQSNWEDVIPQIIKSVSGFPEAKVAISRAFREKKLLVSPEEVLS